MMTKKMSNDVLAYPKGPGIHSRKSGFQASCHKTILLTTNHLILSTCSLYVSGCLFACPGCYNKVAQNFHYGKPYTQELEDQIIADLGEDYVQGLTLLGGEPFLNTDVCLKLVRRIRKEYGDIKDIWYWSGYTWDELLLDSEDKLELLHSIDILVDGRFREDLKDLSLQFRGSSNQRIIDVKKSFEKGEVVIWEGLVR